MLRLTTIVLASALFASTDLVAQRTCSVTPYGQGCGPVATGSVEPSGNTHRVAFTISQAKGDTPVLFIVGVNEQKIPLFNSGCDLLTELAFTQAHRTDPTGTYTFSKALPSTYLGQARIQFVEADLSSGLNGLRATNGLLLDCR